MSKNNKKTDSKNKEAVNMEELSKPWIQRRTGFLIITALSIGIMILVAVQIIMGSGDWGRGLLWGFLFGGSIWFVFFGMNWFHSLFHSKPNQTDDTKEQK
ncbi:MAG: hypothetical protein RBS09_07775 [Anaerolineaceae bacterium]|jgi:hypothetical protein|nr:hypothetical protein [Anaerolineaceae bacterium]